MSLFVLGALFKIPPASTRNGSAFPAQRPGTAGSARLRLLPGRGSAGRRSRRDRGHVASAPGINHPRFGGYLSGCPNPCQLTDASLLESCRRRQRCYRRHRERGRGHARDAGNYRNASPRTTHARRGRLAGQANPGGSNPGSPSTSPCL